MMDGYSLVRGYALGDLLREQRRSRPALLAAVDGDLRYDYRTFDSRVNKLASALRARGVGEGDRFLWLGQNSARLMELIFAGAKLGAATCPVNWRASIEETVAICRDFDPKVIVWQDAELGQQHSQARKGWQDAKHIWIQHDGDDADGWEAFLADGEDLDDDRSIDPNLPVLAIYTAAFSGRAGAAMLSHNALLLQALISTRGQAVDENTRYLVSGPMFHIGVMMGAFATILSGGACVYLARVRPEDVLRSIAEERATHAFIPEPIVEPMRAANADGRYDLSSLFADHRMSDWSSAISMPKHAPLLGHQGVYGQTEVMGMVVLRWLGGTGAGRPAPFVQVRLLDDAGQEVPDGQVGEIAVRGPMVMNGYFDRPEDNAARSQYGWHTTRDLGRRLEDGSISFVGPKTTLIKSGIENIYPAEVENCIRQHPEVADVCVIGVPSPEWDQDVKAVVVLKPNATASAADIIGHCRETMASYKKPKIVIFVDELPRTTVGFVDRGAVDANHGGGGYPQII